MTRFLSKENIGELIRYGGCGVATTIINILTYRLLLQLSVAYWISNFIALLTSKIFAYIVNKKIVFRSRCQNKAELIKEVCRYMLARGFTGLVDYFGLILAVSVWKFDEIYAKYVLQAIVIILNFFFGKKLVFQKKPREAEK